MWQLPSVNRSFADIIFERSTYFFLLLCTKKNNEEIKKQKILLELGFEPKSLARVDALETTTKRLKKEWWCKKNIGLFIDQRVTES